MATMMEVANRKLTVIGSLDVASILAEMESDSESGDGWTADQMEDFLSEIAFAEEKENPQVQTMPAATLPPARRQPEEQQSSPQPYIRTTPTSTTPSTTSSSTVSFSRPKTPHVEVLPASPMNESVTASLQDPPSPMGSFSNFSFQRANVLMAESLPGSTRLLTQSSMDSVASELEEDDDEPDQTFSIAAMAQTAMQDNRLPTMGFIEGATESYRQLGALAGWLQKQSPSHHKWQRRWVVVQGNYMLWSKKQRDIHDPTDPKQRKKFNNCISLLHISKVLPVSSKHGRKFDVKTANRVYHWRAATREDRNTWVSLLHKHLELLDLTTRFMEE